MAEQRLLTCWCSFNHGVVWTELDSEVREIGLMLRRSKEEETAVEIILITQRPVNKLRL